MGHETGCAHVMPDHANGVFTPEQDNDKTNFEPVQSYDAFHTRHVGPGVKGIIGMHSFNICLVIVLSLSCSGVKTPLECILPVIYVSINLPQNTPSIEHTNTVDLIQHALTSLRHTRYMLHDNGHWQHTTNDLLENLSSYTTYTPWCVYHIVLPEHFDTNIWNYCLVIFLIFKIWT